MAEIIVPTLIKDSSNCSFVTQNDLLMSSSEK